MNFCFITFGCKLNQAESDMISADLNSSGFRTNNKNPDFIFINACAVTHKATRAVRQKLARLSRQSPHSKIILTGCVEKLTWPNVDLYIHNKDKTKLVNLIIQKFKLAPSADSFSYKLSRQRALIKIQDGCSNYCAYCIVPFMRGSPKSRPVNQIISDIKQKAKQGFKEIVLTGVNIGLYHYGNIKTSDFKQRQNKNSKNLVSLLKLILKETTIPRLRLGSLWPTHISLDLINLYSKNSRLCPHFHLSLQSGSDKILKAMNRNYTIHQVTKIIQQAQSKIPHLNLTCDMIVGFPGESDKDFSESCQLIKNIDFSKVHLFKYSPRPGTRAAKMPNQINERIKQRRSQKLFLISNQASLRTKQKFIGQEMSVLWEAKKAAYYYGFTDNYIRVRKKVKQNVKLDNRIEKIALNRFNLIF